MYKEFPCEPKYMDIVKHIQEFSSSEPAILLVSTKNRDSGQVKDRKSAIYGLPVKYYKSDWLRIRNEYLRVLRKSAILDADQKDRGFWWREWHPCTETSLKSLTKMVNIG